MENRTSNGGAGPLLVGRELALAELEQQLDRTAEAGRLVLIAGEAGMGKSALAEAFLASLHARDILYRVGRCTAEPFIAYEPFVEALADQFPQLEPSTSCSASPAHVDPDAARKRLFEEVLARLVPPRPSDSAVLVLEDLHWAEPSTLQLLAHVVRASRHRLLVVGTLRDPDPDRGRTLARALAQLRFQSPTATVRVTGLSAGEVAVLSGRLTGRELPGAVTSQLHDQSGGNPMFLRTLLAHLDQIGALVDVASDGGKRLAETIRNEVPPDIMALAVRRLDLLGQAAKAVLQAAAVCGTEFRLEEVRRAAARSVEEAVAAADAAAEIGLLEQIPGTQLRLRFQHALLRQAILAGVSPCRTALLHLKLAEAIESGDDADRVGELAHHFAQAAGLGASAVAVRYARAAAANAQRDLAFEEQAKFLELALACLPNDRDGWRERYALLMELGLARYRQQGPDHSQEVFNTAAQLADQHDDAERLARAALGAGFERYLRPEGASGEDGYIQLLERAKTRLDEGQRELKARVLTALSLERCFIDRLDQRIGCSDEAVREAERLGDEDVLLDALTARQVALWHPRHTAQLLAQVPELVAGARDRRRLDLAVHLHATAYGYALELNLRDELEWHLACGRDAAQRLGVPVVHLRVEALELVTLLIDGRLREAEAALSALAPLAQEMQPSSWEAAKLVWSFALLREGSGLQVLREPLSRAVAAMPALVPARGMLAEVCSRTGRHDEARTHLDVLAADHFSAVHDDFLALGVLSNAATAAAFTGHVSACRVLLDLLQPFERRNAIVSLFSVDRPVAHSLGLLANALGDHERGLMHFEQAAESAVAFRAPLWEGHALCELGATLRRLGRRQSAREPLRHALELAYRCGATALAERAQVELNASGARLRRRRLTGIEALTPSEARVVKLAVEGRTNSEIAQELFVARRTVETHLTHAFGKLGVAGRDELARVAAGVVTDGEAAASR